MSYYGSQGALNMDRRFGSKPDLTGGGSFHYARSEVVQGGGGGGGNSFEPVVDQYNTYNFSRSSLGRVAGGMEGATVSRMASGMVSANAGGMGGGMVSGMGGEMLSGMGGEMMSSMAGGMMSGGGGGMMSGGGGGMMSGMGGGMGGEMMSGMRISKGGGMVISKGGGMVISKGGGMGGFQQEAMALQSQCQEYLRQAEYALQSGSPGDAQNFMGLAKESIGQLRNLAIDLKQMGQPADNIVRSVDIYNNQLSGVHKVYTSTLQRRKSHKGSSGGYDEPPRSYNDALGWISQQKRLIETAPWGDDPATIEQQLATHQRFHASIQRSTEVDRARDDLVRTRDKANLHALDQEWDSLQKLSFSRTQQLQDLLQIIQEISTEIMWVNDKEEQELVFDWGDKNVDQYIPRKQESYSKLMSALEDKEKDLNKLKARVDNLLKNNHPASDKIEAYKDTLQTQWSWILQITKCIDTHLKENAAYSQFFKEAKETQENLQRDHETVKKKFTCDKNSSLEDLLVVLKDLEMEKGRILENKRQVQNLVNRSKDIVRLKPRNPEHKSSSPIIVKALCDFRQEQKVICKGNEAILKNNSQRSKWDVTGPGGLDMSVPSVCLIVPPPNPLSISVANKQEEYYETILAFWNQLYINVKSLIAWQCCLQDIQQINSLNLSLISKMRPDQYQQLIRSLETHYEEFKRTSYGSQMFVDEEKRSIEDQITGAQTHYGQLVLQLPTYIIQQEEMTVQQEEARRLEEEAARRRLEEEEARRRMEEEEARRRLAEEEARRRLEEEERRKAEERRIKEQSIEKVVVRKTGAAAPKKKVSSSRSLSELHTLRLRLEASEAALSQHVHICLGDDGMHECSSRIIQLETARRDVNDIRELFLRLRERILKELEGMTDTDKAGFLRSEIEVIDQRLADLDGSSAAYLQRLQALKDLLEQVAQVEDIVKVYEARLTEKETTSLSSAEVEDYIGTLTKMKAELDQKQDVLASMEAELDKAGQWSGQVGGPFYRCDLMLSKHSEQVGQLSDRWRRIQGQINTRLQDLQFYQPQLVVYKQSSTSLSDWIDVTRKKQDALQAARIDNLDVLKDNMSSQKVLNSEIISKRDELENVLKDNDACFHSVKDYETDLAAYSSGLETLLNIPIKRPMLVSPSMDLSQEAIELQTRYMELLTRSGDHYKFMGELQKKMDELKIRNTRIEVLEEELQNLRGDIQGSQDTNKFQLADLRDQMTNLTYLIEEEKRKTRLAEERYTQQQDEYDTTLKKRQSELETVSWSKVEVERSLANKDREIEKLRRQLDEEAERIKELQREISKVRSQCSVEINNIKLSYESQIQVSRADVQRLASQREDDSAELQLQYDRMEAERRNLEDELRRLRMSISEAEEQRKRVEEEARSQRAVITEEAGRRRELESQVEMLMRQRDEESRQHREELAEALKNLEEKSEELVYITHSLEEETRRRRTAEEGQGVLEESLSQMKGKLSSSSLTVTQLGECKEELQTIRLELERESRERSRVEQNLSRLQVRMKDLQAVRDSLESQVENLRKASLEEVEKRRQVEVELGRTTTAISEYTSTISALRQSKDQASMSEKKGVEQRLRLQEELERSSRQNKTSGERITQLSMELTSLQQQLFQEQARVAEGNLKNENLYKTIEERKRAANETAMELQKLKELIETYAQEKLRLQDELEVMRLEKAELFRSKQAGDDELSSQISALELQLQASERSHVEYSNLASELSSEREKLKLEIEKIQTQATETTVTMKSLQSQYNDIVAERDALLLKLQMSGKDKDQLQHLEEELNRIKLSLETELRNKQRLQDEMERVKRDLSYWKDQYESKQGLIRQSDSDKDRLERERTSLKSEIERLMRELRDLEDKYKIKMTTIQKELQEVNVVRVNLEAELRKAREPPTFDASTLVFDGVRKPVTANQLLECAVLDKPTFNQLVKGHKTIPEVSADKKVNLKGTGPIAGVVIEGPRGSGSSTGPMYKMTLTEAKKENLLPADSADLLLDAQAATGHIIDPRTNQKLTVEEASKRGVIDENDRERLLAAEAAAVGYSTSSSSKPLSAFQALKKGLIDRNTALRLLQAQESTGGVLDPVLSVFLPKDTAISRDLIDDNIYRALNQRPELYLDPESEEGVTYMSMKRRCKVELNTGLLLLPISDKVDPSKLVFDGVRKPVSATQLLECSVLDKPTFKDLVNLKKTVPEVAVDKNVNLKGTGPIAGVIAGNQGKLSLSEAKKRSLLPEECADLLLEAQAATGHIIDPTNNQKLTVEEACARGVVESRDRDRLLAAEAAAVGYKNPGSAKPLSVFEAMRKGITDKKTGLRLLQAQESVGGVLDPILSVFLPKDTAIKRNLLDENLRHALKQNPSCYTDPETEQDVSYSSLKKRCMTEPHTGLLFLPITEKLDPSKLIFEGVRKPVTAQQLLDCGVLDKLTFNQLVKGEKTVPEVSADKKVFLKGTGSIAGVAAGPLGKMSLAEAKRQMLMPPESADMLLDAQAATGHIIDPTNNRKLTVEEACARGVVDNRDRDRLLEAEAAAVGYRDPSTAKPLSVFGAMKKGLIDKKSALRLLQAQESAGGILDPNLSVFLPKDTAIMRNILDDDISRALNMKPECYIDPDSESDTSYGSLKKRSKTESHTGLILLPITERKDPSKMMFDGVRKLVTAQQLFDCGVLDKPTFNQLVKGEKTVPSVSVEKKVYLKGSGPIAGVLVGRQGQLSFAQAKKQLLSEDCADLLLEAQAATGHIIDPETNQKLTVEEACARGVVDIGDRERLLAAEAAAVGYTDPSTGKPLSVFEAMKKGIIDKKTGLRLLQAQESMGGILDPSLSVFLPKDTAIKHNLLDENLRYALRQSPGAYLDPETDSSISYGALKERCLIVPHSGLHFLPVSEKADPSSLLFDGVRKTVTAQQLFDCGILDKQTFDQLLKGDKTVSDVSVDLKVFLKGTGTVAGVAAGPLRKMSFTEAKKQKIMPSDSADLLLEAQAATGFIIDPKTNQKLSVKEACSRGLVDKEDESKLFAAEAGAVGYRVSGHTNVLSVGQAMKRGLISKEAALRMLQAQQSAGGILDPVLSVFLPIGMALDRGLLDDDLHHALNQYPACYLDPDDQQATTYVSLKRKCKADPSSGILLLPEPKKPVTVRGLRGQVSVLDLVDANLLGRSDMDQLRNGRLTSQDIENRLQPYLRGSTCIAGVYDEASDKVMPIYQAMKDGLLQPKEALELLEAQAASGFIVDPVNDLYLTVSEAYNRRLFGPELKDNLLSAEKAVTGYRLPGTDKVISLFQAIENGMVEKGHGTRLLEAQIASGGIIDPERGHRVNADVAYKRGYLDLKMNQILTNHSKGFIDPNTDEKVSYQELKKRCITDKHPGLILLPIKKSQESTQKNTVRKTRVLIVDPQTNKEMTIRQAYDKGLIDYQTFLDLSKQEAEWEEITITDPDGSTRFIIVDRKTDREYDITDLLEKRVIRQSDLDRYKSRSITLTEFADIITNKTSHIPLSSVTSRASVLSTTSSAVSSSSRTSAAPAALSATSRSSSSSVVARPLSPTLAKMTTTRTTTLTERSTSITSSQDEHDGLRDSSSVSFTLSPPFESVNEQEPIGAVFDTENIEKITITEALNRGLVDSITAQRLLEAQACTGGIVNPTNGQRFGVQEAARLGLITDDMAVKLKPAQKAYIGFEDVKTRKRMSAAEAIKENWLPYEAGNRFLEFQIATGGLCDPDMGCRRTIQDALKLGWFDENRAQKLQDIKHHTKNMTCPKSKLKISYKEALDNCLVEERTGVKMLQASSVSSKGISSPYNVSSAPGSSSGSRSGSRRSSRRGSVDLSSPITSTSRYSKIVSFSTSSR